MKKFPFSLKLSIPITLVSSFVTLGIILFNQDVNRQFKITENTAREYLRTNASQTSRILDYLYRRKDIEEAQTAIISQLGSNNSIDLVLLINDNNLVYESTSYELVNNPLHQTIARQYIKQIDTVRKKLAGEIILSENEDKYLPMPIFFVKISGYRQ